MAGTLYVVATPIGNLEDLSFRALRTLKEVTLIVAEDTRRTAKLLAQYSIATPLASLHAHNEFRSVPALIGKLQAGDSLALVSDAGTPAIADPGEHLVRAAHAHGIRVSAVPGPSAITAALSAAGCPASEFVFMGFVPRSGRQRTDWFQRLADESRTVVFFEAPHRIRRTLGELTVTLVSRPIIINRELTKIHEELVIQPNTTSVREQGEFVVVVGQSVGNLAGKDVEISPDLLKTALLMVDCLTRSRDFDRKAALELASKATGVDLRILTREVKKQRFLVNQQKNALP